MSHRRNLSNQTFHTRSSAHRHAGGHQQQHSVSTRRNYYSATESCGEDDVFDTKPKQSYASITLRSPFKEVNYFSDTEARNPRPINNNARIKNQQPKPFYPPQYVSHSVYQQTSTNQSGPISTLPPSYYDRIQQNQTTKNIGSFSLLGQKRHGSVSTSSPHSQQPFTVPNIYEKLNLQQHAQPHPYFVSHDTEAYMSGYHDSNLDSQVKRSTLGRWPYGPNLVELNYLIKLLYFKRG
jgi:hypothetical protein